ncbi:RICIN domain-containing protein [Streptomyces sp. NPDC012508]
MLGFALVSRNVDRCVSRVDGSTDSGTALELWDCNGQSCQKWKAA